MVSAHRIVLVAAVAFAAAVSGCDCGGQQGPQPVGRASIIARFVAGNSVQADNQSRLKISLTALNKDHKPDLNPISVTAPTGQGFLAKSGGDLQADTVTEAPAANGTLDIDFQCPLNASNTVTLTATNGDATTNIAVTCLEPNGQIAIQVSSNDCQNIQSDGFSTCSIVLDVHEIARGVTIPFGDPINVKVATVTPVDPTATGTDAVLAPDGATAGGSSSIIVTPDTADGLYHFTFLAPNVAETASLVITANDVTSNLDVPVSAFTNHSAVIIGGTLSAPGDSDAVVTISVTDPFGHPSASIPGDVVGVLSTVKIDGTGATLNGSASPLTDVALAADGTASITVHTPSIAPGDPAQTFTITATYDPQIGNLQPKDGTAVFTATAPGTLTLNATANPTGVDSTTSLAQRTITLSIDLKVDQTGSDGTATVTIDNDSLAVLTLDETGATRVSETTVAITGGTAEVPVVVEPNVPSSPANITVTAVDTSNNVATPDQHIKINVTRPPILTTIAFEQADPILLGTAGNATTSGSALPAVSNVTFQLLDDSGQPLPGVEVTFDKNSTADRGIGVTLTDISDTTGHVSTTVSAGSVPGPVTIIAHATDPVTGQQRTGQSAPINIVNALPSFETSFLLCGNGVVALSPPWSVACTAQIVDRFTNTVDNIGVQFFAEAGNEQATNTTANGAAAVTVSSDLQHGNPSADVLGWSQAPLVPTSAGDLAGGSTFVGADVLACFDDTTTTPCDLVKLCEDPDLGPTFCPLKANCAATAQQAIDVLNSPPNALDFGNVARPGHAAAVAAVSTYLQTFRACGYPAGCFTGQTGGLGLSATDGDECPLNLGCFDFSGTTECPQDTLRTILATTRGAEPFSDGNGDGLFEAGESFADMPEPFLDQNDNCDRDDFTGLARFQNQPILAVTNTDKFFDVDGNQVFGFGNATAPSRTNGVWDFDTQIMLNTHILEIGGANATIGVDCSETPGTAHVCPGGGSATCTETADGSRIAACAPADLAIGGAEDIAFRWSDAHGNCPSQNMADDATVESTGPIEISGETDVTLGAGACGYGDVNNPLQPECISMPFLGAPVLHMNVVENCAGQTGDQIAKLTFTLGDAKETVVLHVNCG